MTATAAGSLDGRIVSALARSWSRVGPSKPRASFSCPRFGRYPAADVCSGSAVSGWVSGQDGRCVCQPGEFGNGHLLVAEVLSGRQRNEGAAFDLGVRGGYFGQPCCGFGAGGAGAALGCLGGGGSVVEFGSELGYPLDLGGDLEPGRFGDGGVFGGVGPPDVLAVLRGVAEDRVVVKRWLSSSVRFWRAVPRIPADP